MQEVQKRVRNDAEVVRIVRWLNRSGAVMLTGTFMSGISDRRHS
ncbi:MAG: hypothetical protein U0802_12755 [Candidatus Binatia bacterium]